MQWPQENNFFGAFSIFESGGIPKHLMTGPSGKSEFCFPLTSVFPSASPRGTLRVSGKQNSLFPLWPVIKCLLTTLQDGQLGLVLTMSVYIYIYFSYYIEDVFILECWTFQVFQNMKVI